MAVEDLGSNGNNGMNTTLCHIEYHTGRQVGVRIQDVVPVAFDAYESACHRLAGANDSTLTAEAGA